MFIDLFIAEIYFGSCRSNKWEPSAFWARPLALEQHNPDAEWRALLLLHAETLSEQGVLPGLRDEGALDAALARPRHVYSYQRKPDLARLAAGYAFAIIRNQPFHHGTKRAGFLAMRLRSVIDCPSRS